VKRYVIAAVVAALFTGSCGGGNDVAATVNGVDIGTASVQDMVRAEEPLDASQFRGVLTAVIQWAAIADAARDEFDIDFTDAEISDYSDGIVADAGGTRQEYLDGNQVSEAGFLLYAEQLMIGERMIEIMQGRVETPTDEEAQQVFIDDPASWTIACTSHILLETEDEANAALARLNDGEDFAALASELSIDTSTGASGGELGCATPAAYGSNFGTDEFTDVTLNAEIGVVTGPVETTYGFHLIRVDSRTEATLDDLRQGLIDQETSNLVSDWYLTAVTDADISVNPDYGSWETDPVPTIVAPVS
jgi:parvulin-like peptidyl-prolyl isomerase